MAISRSQEHKAEKTLLRLLYGRLRCDGMRKALRRLEFTTLPSWFVVPLVVLGGMYLIALPFGVAGERGYHLWSLAVAAAGTLLCIWRYQMSVVERTEDSVLVRCGLRKSSSARNPQERD